MTSAEFFDIAFPFDPSRLTPAEAIFANPSVFGLWQSESLSDTHSTEAIQIENCGLMFQIQDGFEAGGSLTVSSENFKRRST